MQHRLQHWLERAGKLNRNQAGFRKGHSTMDQLARVTQTIFDGFESKKPQRAVLVLLDYARAYDRVWRDALYAKIGRMGVPGCVASWIRALLSDRRARVRWGTSASRWRVFQEGLPQGSVLAPSSGSSTVTTSTTDSGPATRSLLSPSSRMTWPFS